MFEDVSIRPMPSKYGFGFVAEKPLPAELSEGYRYEPVGLFHNYHYSKYNWKWPNFKTAISRNYLIDGFSPNLNKSLHVGHLRQLALAKSLSQILKNDNANFVALLGASLGVIQKAVLGWTEWTNFVNYHPTVYYDICLPKDIDIGLRKISDEENSAQFIDGVNEPIIAIRSDGRPLYSYYDAIFAKFVSPTHYITGEEQKTHFADLGLADKHLSMGLVLGKDGSKLKSRTGDAMLASEVLEIIQDLLTQHKEKGPSVFLKEIAWNILCWNFLHASRDSNLKFEIEKWVRSESPGMYITYTYARILKAIQPRIAQEFEEKHSEFLSEKDVQLLGLSEQYFFYHQKSVEKLDPSPLANFAHELARKLNNVYEGEKIREGREVFIRVVLHALFRLEKCMEDLGMFLVTEV